MHGPETRDAEKDSDNAFEDEDPCPAWTAAETVHLVNCCGQETTEGAGDSCCREEDGCTDTEFRAFIPAGEVIVDSGEKTGFCEAEEPLRALGLNA